jgi:hypothetical protein
VVVRIVAPHKLNECVCDRATKLRQDSLRVGLVRCTVVGADDAFASVHAESIATREKPMVHAIRNRRYVDVFIVRLIVPMLSS